MQGTSVKQIFISHAIEDADFANRLADDLKRLGARVWIAPDSILPSEPWLDAIERGLRESSHVVIVLTPAALEASGAKMERDMAITLALDDRIQVISLRLKPCDVPLVLSRYQMILAFQEDYEAGLNQLAGHLGLRVESSEAEAEKKPEPTVRRLPGLPLLALVALLALVIGAVVVGAVASGLIGGGEELVPTTTTSTSLVADEPTHTPRLDVATSTPTSASVLEPPTGPTSTSKPEATDTLVPEMTDTPVPPTDTPVPASSVAPSSGSLYDTWTRPADGMEMVYVPGGTFEMGSTDAEVQVVFERCEQERGGGECQRNWLERESPRHSVTLDSFWIDRTEVTNAQYARCVADGTCTPPSESISATRDSYYGEGQFDDYPVIWVSWSDANAYCEWAGGRLPTEAEWEFAARGPDGNVYSWGNDTPDDSLLNYDSIVGDTTEVRSYPDGASWVGALDMAGNVWEWVSDWYAEYAASSAENPAGPDTGDEKVLRGGSWDYAPYIMRSAFRLRLSPVNRNYDVGFRCVVASTSVPIVADTPTSQLPTPVPGLGVGSTLVRERDGMEMVYVPGGTFPMGSTEGHDDEQPVHSVTLDTFWIDKTEVTNAQFERFVQATNYRTTAEKEGTGWVYNDGSWNEVDGADWQHVSGPETSISDRMDHPVVQVSWNDARTYCQWVGGRLPTEAEWEYAARGPDGFTYPWGDAFDGRQANFCDANCPLVDWKDVSYDDRYERTAPVGSYPAGASWTGALDMAGNVWEWVDDWYDGYPGTTYRSEEFGTSFKVMRGGSWNNIEEHVRAADRALDQPVVRIDLYGFRCVAEPGD